MAAPHHRGGCPVAWACAALGVSESGYHARAARPPSAADRRREKLVAAIKLGARLEGMITDPVYEGKSLAGMIDMIANKEIERGSKVLYAHLGGQPALNAYSALFA